MMKSHLMRSTCDNTPWSARTPTQRGVFTRVSSRTPRYKQTCLFSCDPVLFRHLLDPDFLTGRTWPTPTRSAPGYPRHPSTRCLAPSPFLPYYRPSLHRGCTLDSRRPFPPCDHDSGNIGFDPAEERIKNIMRGKSGVNGGGQIRGNKSKDMSSKFGVGVDFQGED